MLQDSVPASVEHLVGLFVPGFIAAVRNAAMVFFAGSGITQCLRNIQRPVSRSPDDRRRRDSPKRWMVYANEGTRCADVFSGLGFQSRRSRCDRAFRGQSGRSDHERNHAATGSVIGLGPGTGVFTEALLARGVRESDLTLIEYGSDFMRLLQLRFPRARVLWMDAAWVGSHNLFEGRPVGAVVSGLPLLNMTPRKVVAILTGAFRNLRAGGALYQFSYGMWCPVPRAILERLGLKATCIGRVLLNVPPASVYRITRRKPCKLVQI